MSEELTKRFNVQLATYFRDVYSDQILRMHSNTVAKDLGSKSNILDKVTLMEFLNLPGIMADRFYSQVGTGSKTDQRIVQDKFVSVMQTIYNSSLEDKMRLTFEIYDFD